MQKTYKGDRPDGSPIFEYDITEDVPALQAGTVAQFHTGPATGTLTMEDGTEYGVADEKIIVQAKHLSELHLAIHREHHANGRFLESPIPEDEYRSFLTDHVVHGGPGPDVDPGWGERLAPLIADRTPEEIAESQQRLADRLAAQGE